MRAALRLTSCSKHVWKTVRYDNALAVFHNDCLLAGNKYGKSLHKDFATKALASKSLEDIDNVESNAENSRKSLPLPSGEAKEKVPESVSAFSTTFCLEIFTF